MEGFGKECFELLVRLYGIGVEAPNLLIHLANFLKGPCPQEQIISELQSLFKNVPGLLQNTSSEQRVEDLFKTEHPFSAECALLLEFRELQQVLQETTHLQLLHLTNNTIPPGPQNLQLEYLQKIQQQFHGWNEEKLKILNNLLMETPLHMERRVLIECEPSINWEILHFLIEMLKLPLGELFSFQRWISKLSRKHLIYLVNLLSFNAPTILELKTRLDFNTPSYFAPLTSNPQPVASTSQQSDVMDISSSENPSRSSSATSLVPISEPHSVTFPAPPPSAKSSNQQLTQSVSSTGKTSLTVSSSDK